MTDFFKDLVYSKDDVIVFEKGLPGFEDHREFVLVQTAEYAPFEWLACVDGSRIRFAVLNPMLFRPDYSPKITREQLDELGIAKPEDILIYSIVTIQANPAESTANLAGPVVINRLRKMGRQVILEDDRYSTREPILGKK